MNAVGEEVGSRGGLATAVAAPRSRSRRRLENVMAEGRTWMAAHLQAGISPRFMKGFWT
jgi:hypothetical protein